MFEIEGLRLGMTLEQVKSVKPALKYEELHREGDALTAIRGEGGGLHLRFTGPSNGSLLYYIEKREIFKDPPDPFMIFQKLVQKYGRPDYSGRDMWRAHAVWGKPVGKIRRLQFELTIAGKGDSFPFILFLYDPITEARNLNPAPKPLIRK
ncbi:MAG: hypothetical protein HY751_01510 [Nitrospinae bacterium]|nr:hypothetical protein [Nitrospinota bacterium]